MIWKELEYMKTSDWVDYVFMILCNILEKAEALWQKSGQCCQGWRSAQDWLITNKSVEMVCGAGNSHLTVKVLLLIKLHS